MGFGSWLRQALQGGSATAPALDSSKDEQRFQPALKIEVSLQFNACLEVAGTTTFAKEAVAAFAERRGLGGRGYFEGKALLQREPENPVDPWAVAVVVDGEKIGSLPSYVAKDLPLPAGASQQVSYQLHVLREQKLLAKAFVWLGPGEPEWAHTRENPPALTSRERINSSHAETSAMVREALQGGGERAQQFQRGMVDGVHYLELIEPIKQIKREGRLEEALVLCYKAIEGAERGRRTGHARPGLYGARGHHPPQAVPEGRRDCGAEEVAGQMSEAASGR
ncbi:hypothetical protein NG701_16110 [Pseudarthrobacter sp. HLT3-5]|uniref:hypothetical protein n=1 Tax=Pseudarthrobacter cellobiosi TaxID=2953654 RepID=UPI00208EAECB|nr:hypothetical protein [Pseudarthrobacter sp. HLT3-5]MCO4275933.1 hypothetical protein [Pseudarthrobacter sp. HLT3-5]